MVDVLRKRRFTPKDLQLRAIQNCDCGTEDWEREVAEWIKGPVLQDIERGCEVWLYFIKRNKRNEMVGFGSLAEPNWVYPKPGEKRPNLIPMLGISKRFQGQPEGPPEERYAVQILSDLILSATQHTERSPLLVLYVHPGNTKAIHFYEKFGFAAFSKTYHDHEVNVVYKSMILTLPTNAIG